MKSRGEESAKLTNYGEFLEKHPPKHLVEIVENSSWSCVHGVERWRSDCGCNSGGHPWNQQWRAPLRAALDWLRDKLAPIFESQFKEYLRDPWQRRDDYIRVILDRSEETRKAFFADHAIRPLEAEEQVKVLKLLEMQRHALLMYTSCGWFFDELSGIGNRAGHPLRRARAATGGGVLQAKDSRQSFCNNWHKAKSNLPEHGDGAKIYEKWVKPAVVDIERVAGHYAISSLFENYADKTRIYCYEVEREQIFGRGGREDSPGHMAALGSAPTITEEIRRFGFFGPPSWATTISRRESAPRMRRPTKTKRSLSSAFAQADTAEVIRLLDQVYGKNTFSLRLLFRDEQRKITSLILNESLNSAAAVYRTVFESQAPLIRFLNGLDIPVPTCPKVCGRDRSE